MASLKYVLALVALLMISTYSSAESLRCHGDLVGEGDTKAQVFEKCGEPEFKDSFCEKVDRPALDSEGRSRMVTTCERVDVWTYNPGTGQFWTNVYFTEGKVRDLKYGDRVK